MILGGARGCALTFVALTICTDFVVFLFQESLDNCLIFGSILSCCTGLASSRHVLHAIFETEVCQGCKMRAEDDSIGVMEQLNNRDLIHYVRQRRVTLQANRPAWRNSNRAKFQSCNGTVDFRNLQQRIREASLENTFYAYLREFTLSLNSRPDRRLISYVLRSRLVEF